MQSPTKRKNGKGDGSTGAGVGGPRKGGKSGSNQDHRQPLDVVRDRRITSRLATDSEPQRGPGTSGMEVLTSTILTVLGRLGRLSAMLDQLPMEILAEVTPLTSPPTRRLSQQKADPPLARRSCPTSPPPLSFDSHEWQSCSATSSTTATPPAPSGWPPSRARESPDSKRVTCPSQLTPP